MSSRVPLAMLALALSAVAQCAPSFSNGLARAGVDGDVRASTMWDPDGAGPLAPRLVIGGHFMAAGGVAANRIAVFDFTTSQWSSLGGGMAGGYDWAPHVAALLVMPNGDLCAGGSFTRAGNTAAANVARWNGSVWQPLGSGVAGESVYSLALLGSGDVVAAGRFSSAGGVAANNIARWDGSQWHAMGSGIVGSNGGTVGALCARPNGDLIVGGDFTSAGGIPAVDVARWNGASWSAFSNSPPNIWHVRAFAELPGGDLLAAGAPTGGNTVARCIGSTWSAFGTGNGLNGAEVTGLRVLPNGNVVAMRFQGGIWQCAGASSPWTLLQPLDRAMICEPQANGDLVFSGRTAPGFTSIVDHIGRWNGTSWLPMSGGVDDAVCAAVEVPGGYVVGGSFLRIGGIVANRIARWDGAAWHALGSGANGIVERLVRLPNGDVVARGQFTTIGGIAAQGIASWNGSTWSSLGGGPGFTTFALAVLPSGELVAGGWTVKRWDGNVWSTLGNAPGGAVLHVRPNGDLIAGITGPSPIAQWNGTAWTPISNNLSGTPAAFGSDPGGVLYASGNFSLGGAPTLARVVRWDGLAWSAVGPSESGVPIYTDFMQSLLVLPDGDLLAAGNRTNGGVSMNCLGRWNGSAWMPVGSGVDGKFRGMLNSYFTTVRHLEPLSNGRVLVCGDFGRADAIAAGGLFELTPGCSSGAAPIPVPGCFGPAGPLVLTAAADPQIGFPFVSQTSGCSPTSIAVAVFGFRPVSLPSPAAPIPFTAPGCRVFAAPDVLVPIVPANGIAVHTLPMPSAPSFVGVPLWHQFAHLELTVPFGAPALTVSNGLVLTIGP